MRFYGALARGGELDGVRILSPAQIERCLIEQSSGIDAVANVPMRFGLGYRLTQPAALYGPNPRTFGHTGAGGSLGFADPDAKIGFAYIMNQMGSHILLDPRVVGLLNPLYAPKSTQRFSLKLSTEPVPLFRFEVSAGRYAVRITARKQQYVQLSARRPPAALQAARA